MSVPYFNYSFDSETVNSNIITNNIVSHDIPVTDGLYMRFEGKNYDEKTKTWYDSGGSGRHIPASSITGTPTIAIQGNASNGTFLRSFQVLKGGTNVVINFGNPVLEQYTFFHIARYGGTGKNRIFTSLPSPNWLAGFYGGTTNFGYTGVAHHSAWITSSTSTFYGTDFFIGCDCSNSYRTNGIERFTTNGTITYLPTVTVNGYTGETSDFEIADVIIYNRYLSLDERIQIENYLASIYGISASTTTNSNLGFLMNTPTIDTTDYKFGTASLKLAGGASGTSSQHVQLAPCRLGTNGVSFACWFRSLNTITSATYPRIFDFGKTNTSQVALLIDGATGKIGLHIPDLFTNVSSNVIVLTDGPTVLDNIWRHIAWTISPDGTHNVYINGTLIYTNTSYFYPQNYDFTSNLIGKTNASSGIFFNGAIDEFKFYKSTLTADEIYNLYDHNNTYPTITPTTTIPTPYLYYNFDPSGTMPGNLGTYLLNKGTPNQPVIPNTTFVRTNQWSTCENVPIIWTATGSSFMPSTTAIGGKTTNYEPFRAFDGSSNGGWVTAANTYNLQTSTIGDYKGNPATSTTTTINSVSTSINGEWIQIQSTVPVKMTSYKFESYYDNSNALACALPQTYYILGSNNGTTWDPIQYVVNNYASTNDASSNVNYTETFTITNNTTAITSGNYNTKGFETIQGFSTSLNYYSYFRLSVTKVFGKRLGYTNIQSTITNDFLAIGEWNIQFLPQYYYDATLGSSGLIQQSDYRIPNNQVMTNAKADQYIRLPTFSTDITGLTFSCWFRSNNNGTWARLFDFANSLVNDSNNHLILHIFDGGIGNSIRQYLYKIENTNIVPEINDNIWRHVAWTINTNGISTLYINGQSVFSQKAIYPYPINRTTNFLLKSLWNPDPSYNGAIDEFAMYKTVLSDAAINTIYDSTKSIYNFYNDGSNNQIASTYVATPDLYYTFDSDTVRDQYLQNKATGIYDTLMTKDTIIDTTDYKIENGSIALNGLPDTYVQLPKLSATGIDGLTFACWFRSNGNYDNTPIFDFGNGLVSDNISAKINRNNLTLSVNNGEISPFIYNPYFHYKFDASDTNNYRLKNYGGGATDISGQYDAFIGVGASTIVDYATTKTSTQNTQNESLILTGADNQKITLPAFTSGQDGLTFSFWMRSDSNTAGKNGAKIMDLGNDSKTDNITMSIQNDSLCCDVYNNGISSSVNSVSRYKPVFYYNFDDNTVNSTTVANLANGKLTQYGNTFSNPNEANIVYPMLANLYNGATAKAKVLTLSRTSTTNSSSQFMKLPSMYLDSTKGVTMGCWFRTTDTTGIYPRLLTLGFDSGTTNQIGIAITPNRKLIIFSSDTTLRNWDPSIPFTINDGVWRHVMWTINGGTSAATGATWKVYINGVFINKNTLYYPTTGARIYNYVGRSNNSADSTFDGQISEVFVANTELKAEEVFGLYSNNSSFFYGLNDNNWRHYAWTIANNSLYNTPSNVKISNTYNSMTMSTWKLYVNGVLTKTLSNMNFPNNISRISNYICGSNTSTDPTFVGALDDFRMYKSVLSDADIESIYRNPSYSNTATTSTMKNDNIVSNINDNKWRHLTWSIDASANWKIYMNGDLYSKFKGVYPNSIDRYLNFFGKLSKNPDIIDSYYSTFTPNTAAATANTWTNNGITWTSSASSFLVAYDPFEAFNTTTTNADDAWHIADNTSYDGWDGLYNRTTYITNVVSYGLIYGEWLQIQSSIPLVMNSYILTSRNGFFSQMPRQYYIVGSNDQSNWYPIQFVMRQIDSGTPANAVSTSTFFVNTGYYSDSNTSNGTISSNVYGYPTSTNAYTYFRIIVTQSSANTGANVSASGNGRYLAIGEWNITFANAVSKNFAGAIDDFRMYKRVLTDTEVAKMATINPLYFHYRFDQSDVNSQSLANMATGSPIYDASLSTTGLINTTDFKTGNASLALTTDEQEYPPAPITADTTFIYTGSYGQGRYDVSYSSQYGTATNENANKVFSKAPVDTWAGNQWSTASASYASLSSIYSTNNALGHTGTYNTVVSGISISGEWIQLKMPNAIVLNKYMIIGDTGRSMNSFVLAGSNDGNTWTLIDEQRNLGVWSLSQPNCTMYFTPSSVPASYNHFRLIPTSIVGTENAKPLHHTTIRQIKYFAKPEQYVTLPSFWSGYNGLTFSMWFKLNGVSNKNPYFTSLFEFAESNAGISGGNNSIYADIDGNILYFSIFKGSAQSILGLDISMNDNVWRHMAWTVDTNGFWKIYINGRLTKTASKSYPNNIQRYTNYLGRGTQYNTAYNLNGGLDDFRMYKSVLTDQEVMALYKESNKLLIHYTFDKETVNGSSVGDMVGTPAQLSIANGLDFKNTIISPNSANATTANMNGWTTTHDNKVYNWQASASSAYIDGGWLPNNAFNTSLTSMFHINDSVGTKTGYTSATGIYAGDNKTNILSIGNIGGEWLQINCDVPIVMSSYYLVGRNSYPEQFPRSYYIVGSNDGINWYPLQYSTRTGSISGSGNTGAMWTWTTVVATGSNTSPIINMTPYSYDIIPSNASSTLVFKMTGYSYANNPYTMFRIVVTECVSSTVISLAEWYIYAYEPLPSQPIYGSELTPTTYYANSNVETGIWANDGVNWTSSASSQSIGLNTNNTHIYTYYSTKVFNGRIGTGTNIYNGWLSQKQKYATSNVAVNSYTGNYNTYVQTVGTVSGDYLQINSNIPVQMSNYYFTSLIEAANQNLTRYLPQEYYIVGSLDGSSQWFPIQYVNCKGGSAANVASPQNTDIYYTTTKLGETQTIASKTSGTSGSTIDIYNYPVYALGYYTSFRVIVKNTFGNSYGLTDATFFGREVGIGQWNIKFTPHIINPYKYRLGNSSLNLQSSYSEFLTIPTIPTLGTDGISFSLWVSTDGSQEGSQIMELGNGYNNNNIMMYISNGNLYFGINNGNSSNTISHDSMIATKILDGNWRNIVVLIATDGTWTFYVNGQFVKTVAGVYPADVPRYINYLGKSSLKMDPYFNGYIDDFRVYRTVLTTTEIAEIYNSTSTSVLDANGLTGFEYNGIDFSKLYKRKYTESAGIITTIAGGGTSRGDGGLATSASFGTIYDIALDNSNNYIYFSLVDGNYVRRIDASGIITTIVGTGVKNSSGDGGLAINASVNAPSGLSLDSSMNLYIAERDGNRIRKIDIPNGTISTIAGTIQPIATTTSDSSGSSVSNWLISDISFTASMSSIAGNDSRYKAGNGFIYGTHGLDTGVHFGQNTYSSTTGVYSGTRNTTGVIGVPGLTANTLSGDWLQLYSSQQVRMISYNLSAYNLFSGFSGGTRMPQSYYILGSNNGTAWDPIQKVDCSYMSIDVSSLCPTFTYNVTTNYGVQQIGPNPIPNSIGYGAYLNYSYADNSYNFFRISFQRTFGQNGGWGFTNNTWSGTMISIGKWAINFQADCSGTKGSYGDGMLAIGSAINGPQGIRIDSSNNIYISESSGNRIRKIDASSGIISSITGYISPNSALATSKNWIANGTMWDASASSFRTGSINFPYLAFNTGPGTDATTYASVNGSYSATADITLGKYTGKVNTNVIFNSGTQTVSGEWLQIHSGTPCQFISHNLAAWTGDTNKVASGVPASYIIVGSLDGSKWYPIQDVSCGWASVDDTTTPGSTQTYVVSTNSSTIRYGTPNTKGDVYLTGYPTAANYYTYFRLIGREIFNQRFGFTLSNNWSAMFISEWNINFLGGGGYGGASAATASSTGDLSLNGTIIGGIAGNATINYPWGLAFDTSQNLYVAEYNSNRIRKLLTDPSGTISPMSPITTICGNGTMSHTGDGRFAINATIGKPIGIDIDTSNNILLGFDSWQVTNGAVTRMINGNNGIIDKVSGTGTNSFFGDGGFATQALTGSVFVARFDKNRNIYLGDANNARIRKITRLTAPPATNLLRNGVDIANTFSPKTGITTTQLINGIYNTNLQDNIEPIEQQAIPAKGRVFTDNNSWVVPTNPVYTSGVSPNSLNATSNIWNISFDSFENNASLLVYPPLSPVTNFGTTTLSNLEYGNGSYITTATGKNSYNGKGPFYNSTELITGNRWQISNGYTVSSTYNGNTIYSLPANTNLTSVSGVSYNGYWLQIKFPYKIKLNSYSITPYVGQNIIQNLVVAGSNDDTNWTFLSEMKLESNPNQNERLYFNINDNIGFKQYRIIIISGFTISPSLFDFQFYSYTKLSNVTTLTNKVIASNSANGFEPYEAFNSKVLTSNDAWSSTTNLYDTTTGNYVSNTYTYINGIGNVGGEWLQLQTSLPLSMTSYVLNSLFTNLPALPRRYYIIGSNDKLTWHPIQYVNKISSYNGIINTSSTYTVDTRTNYIDNITGDLNENVKSDVTGYSTSSDYYTYFRIITTENCSTSSSQASSVSIGEWTIAGTVLTNPTGWQFSASSEDASMNANAFNAFNNSSTAFWKDNSGNYNSNSGNYCDIVSPNSTAATGFSWTANGITWDASASGTSSTRYVYQAFNSTYGTSVYVTADTNNIYSATTGIYSGNTNTDVQTLGIIKGEWLQIKSSKPCQYLMHNLVSYGGGGNYVNRTLPARYYIVGSNDGNTWYPIQDISYAYSSTPESVASETTQTISMTTNITPRYYGAAGTIGYASIAGYSTSSNYYTHFRMIIKEIFGSRFGYNQSITGWGYSHIAEWNLTLRQGSITSTPFTNTIGNPYSSYRFPVPYIPSTILIPMSSLSSMSISSDNKRMVLVSYYNATVSANGAGLAYYSTSTNGIDWALPLTITTDTTKRGYLASAITSDGTRIAIGGNSSNEVFIYEWSKTANSVPTLLQTLKVFIAGAHGLNFNEDGSRLIMAGGGLSYIYFSLWNNATGRYSPPIKTLQSGSLNVYNVDISKDGNRIVYVSEDTTTRANQKIYWASWNGSNYTDGTQISAPADNTVNPRVIKFNEDASVIYSTSISSTATVFVSYYDYASNTYSAFTTTNSIPKYIVPASLDAWGVSRPENNKYLYVSGMVANTTQRSCTIYRLELAPTNIAEGEWIQVKLPYQLKATNYSIMNRPTTAEKDDLYNEPRIWWLLGSNDGSSWNLIDYRNDTAAIGGALRKFNVNTKDYYSYYRLVISATSATTTTTSATLAQLFLNGIYNYTDSVITTIGTNYGNVEQILPIPGFNPTSNNFTYNGRSFITSSSSQGSSSTTQMSPFNAFKNINSSGYLKDNNDYRWDAGYGGTGYNNAGTTLSYVQNSYDTTTGFYRGAASGSTVASPVLTNYWKTNFYGGNESNTVAAATMTSTTYTIPFSRSYLIGLSITADNTRVVYCVYNTANQGLYFATINSDGTWSNEIAFDTTQREYSSISISADGSRGVVIGNSLPVYYFTWTGTTYTAPISIEPTTSPYRFYRSAKITADGNRIVISCSPKASQGGVIYFSNWNGSSFGPLIQTLETRIFTYLGVALSNDGNRLVYGTELYNSVYYNVYYSVWNGTNYTMGKQTLDTSLRNWWDFTFSNDNNILYGSLRRATGVTIMVSKYNSIQDNYEPFIAVPTLTIPGGLDCGPLFMSRDGNTLYYKDYSSTTLYRMSTQLYQAAGEWIQVQTSSPLKLANYGFLNRQVDGNLYDYDRYPNIFYMLGSNDGSTWFLLDAQSITTTPTTREIGRYSTSTTYATQYYTYFRLVVNKISGTTGLLNLTNVQLFGVYL